MNPLLGLPPLYYINLDRRVDRRQHMETMLSSAGIEGTRISATDGSQPLGDLIDMPNGFSIRLTPNEMACTISHLRAIHTWLTTSDSDCALICEDDLSFETVEHWPFTWTDLTDSLPYYWEIIQLSIIYLPGQEMIVNLHPRTVYDFGAACYLIKRSYAERLMSYYWVANKWKLDYPLSVGLTSEEAVYRPGSCLSIPLFTFSNAFGSNIQTVDHVTTYHTFSREVVLSAWKQLGSRRKELLQVYPRLYIHGGK